MKKAHLNQFVEIKRQNIIKFNHSEEEGNDPHIFSWINCWEDNNICLI